MKKLARYIVLTAYNLTGEKFGKLTTLYVDRDYTKRRKWKCSCDCGKEVSVATDKLISGHTKSCGCLKVGTPTHKLSKTRFYKIWVGVKTRCDRETIGSKYYKDAGITYDDRWRTFENFYDDMYQGYDDTKTLDRIDSTGNYCKENCRWSTYHEQAKNSNKKVTSITGFLNIGEGMNKGVESIVARFNKEGKRYAKTYSLRKYSRDEAIYMSRKYLVEMFIDHNYYEYPRYNSFIESFVKDYGILNLFCEYNGIPVVVVQNNDVAPIELLKGEEVASVWVFTQ